MARADGARPAANGVTVYFSCADCAIEVARAVAAGGSVLMAKTRSASTALLHRSAIPKAIRSACIRCAERCHQPNGWRRRSPGLRATGIVLKKVRLRG